MSVGVLKGDWLKWPGVSLEAHLITMVHNGDCKYLGNLQKHLQSTFFAKDLLMKLLQSNLMTLWWKLWKSGGGYHGEARK